MDDVTLIRKSDLDRDRFPFVTRGSAQAKGPFDRTGQTLVGGGPIP